MINLNNRALNQDIVNAIASLDTRAMKRLPRSVRKQLKRLPSQNDLQSMVAGRFFNRPRKRCLLLLGLAGLAALAALFYFLRNNDDDFDFEIEL